MSWNISGIQGVVFIESLDISDTHLPQHFHLSGDVAEPMLLRSWIWWSPLVTGDVFHHTVPAVPAFQWLSCSSFWRTYTLVLTLSRKVVYSSCFVACGPYSDSRAHLDSADIFLNMMSSALSEYSYTTLLYIRRKAVNQKNWFLSVRNTGRFSSNGHCAITEGNRSGIEDCSKSEIAEGSFLSVSLS